MERSAHRSYKPNQVYLASAAVVAVLCVPVWLFAGSRPGKGILAGAPFLTRLIGVVVLIGAFVCSERWPLKIELRRETVMTSLSEIPLVVGLLAMPGWFVGVAHLSAAGLVFLKRSDPWRSSAVNFAVIAAEAGTAAAIVALHPYTVGRPASGAIYQIWPTAFVYAAIGGIAGALISALAVWLTFRLVGTVEPIRGVMARAGLAAGASTVFAVVGFDLCSTVPGIVLCVGLTVTMVVIYRSYSKFVRQHTDLSRLYAFGRQVTDVGSDATTWPEVLEKIRELLNAEVAMAHLNDPADGFSTITAVAPEQDVSVAPVRQDDELLRVAARSGQLLVARDSTQDSRQLAALASRDAWDVMIVSLRSGEQKGSFLEVRNRRSRWGRFGANDLRLLETLSSTVAAAMDRLRLVERLRHEAYHDAATGLLNWRGLSAEVDKELTAKTIGAVMLLQLEILPEVNNAIGHDRGDRLLVAAADRLVTALGADHLVARIESDRFAVLLPPLDTPKMLSRAAEIMAAVGGAYALDGVEVEPHAHAGIAYVGNSTTEGGAGEAVRDVSTLLQRAEMALMAAQSSSQPLRIYGVSMGEVFRRRFQLVTQFRKAVDDGLITVHYQPKVNLADRSLVGVEALVRWTHPEFGPVSPAEFVEAIETTRSIDTLLHHVLDTVLAQIAAWNKRDVKIRVAVNLSVRNLTGPNFPKAVRAALDKYGVDPEMLTFEITESSVMADPEGSLPILRTLHSMGINLSVDDFGTGYSSLAYLRRLPISEIKIDKSFVFGMMTDLSDFAIVRAIIDLGHSLGLRVVAEGVEEEVARDALRVLKCDEMQGFLEGRPMAIEKLEAWMSTRTVRMPSIGEILQPRRLIG